MYEILKMNVRKPHFERDIYKLMKMFYDKTLQRKLVPCCSLWPPGRNETHGWNQPRSLVRGCRWWRRHSRLRNHGLTLMSWRRRDGRRRRRHCSWAALLRGRFRAGTFDSTVFPFTLPFHSLAAERLIVRWNGPASRSDLGFFFRVWNFNRFVLDIFVLDGILLFDRLCVFLTFGREADNDRGAQMTWFDVADNFNVDIIAVFWVFVDTVPSVCFLIVWRNEELRGTELGDTSTCRRTIVEDLLSTIRRRRCGFGRRVSSRSPSWGSGRLAVRCRLSIWLKFSENKNFVRIWTARAGIGADNLCGDVGPGILCVDGVKIVTPHVVAGSSEVEELVLKVRCANAEVRENTLTEFVASNIMLLENKEKILSRNRGRFHQHFRPNFRANRMRSFFENSEQFWRILT